MKCQKCQNIAIVHITDIPTKDQIGEYHLCDACAHKQFPDPYLKNPNQSSGVSAGSSNSQDANSPSSDDLDEPTLLTRECENCGFKFADFRSQGRLGCPQDYEVFRQELVPLLENIHGETKHIGKTPRRLPQTQATQKELVGLRRRLAQAVHKENYEEAARLRDQIRQLENG